MLHFAPESIWSIIALGLCFLLVCVFEFANGFHDTANAVATVIYTNSLKPKVAVVWSGLMNLLGVLLGGIAVAYTLVELLPPDVLSPPNGNPAVPMLVSLFGTALAWNLLTWWFGIPNSSSHCVIGSLVGIAIGDSFLHARDLGHSVDWNQIWKVLTTLAVSPPLGFIGAGILFLIIRKFVHLPALYERPEPHHRPNPIVRALLVTTCTLVSFSHGNNDGQKSIGLIMLTIIGLMPAAFALNPQIPLQYDMIRQDVQAARPLVAEFDRYSFKADALASIDRLEKGAEIHASPAETRGDIYQVLSGLRSVASNPATSGEQKKEAEALAKKLRPTVEYAPFWVRLLSALCLGVGTMIGYHRIVQTLGEGIGKTHLNPAQGAASEVVGAGLIMTAGYTGLPVSTTHIITSGVAGTMVASGSGINMHMLTKIALAWLFTLPVTITVSAILFYILA
ncbi:inorganic phosphate low-affinity transporter [Gluconobacter thailandicus F149-1 = NBRC 100600]|uniref:Phosphate transporter n=1 Tax=Gluconobacter thailandicus NBRC 3257 TaxID=1381097 RepID=A0ABQ0IZX9_GLUTH|nr:inorganic phosphate transporter [Gluconobacter thailandicus]KXV52753.1 phosphate transporter [Gluconobacter thailandicus]GAC89202.1 phosphate transporter [Gluconobacter thailandicus NBRC 3255]GAD27752.1 phosphate transporter [Gluconobacter thailandicus NBRC 3257]GAN93218.1 inorganic phosphate low-affinity transporter [Gluconobacter thailandicus F149-1 = NBRC 100600]GBR58450.1 inorganic phosphate transporter [Gluconobacter thailandicus F149-1 = NBRC 100600]